MEKRIFKYKIIKIAVIIYSFCMLVPFGVGTEDAYYRAKSDYDNISPGTYFVLGFNLLMFLLCCISLVMVLIGSLNSIIILNAFYILIIGEAFASIFLRDPVRDTMHVIPSSAYLIFAGYSCIALCLIIIINKFKYR